MYSIDSSALILGDASSLANRAYEELKKAIITHRLRPAQRVSEATLTAGFKLGRAAVRIAMKRLVEEGLLVSAGPKTTLVAPLNWQEFHELFHLRVLLETDAAYHACGRVDAEELRRLNRDCERAYRVGDAADELRFLQANRAFHLAVARAARNVREARWIEQVQDALMRVMWLAVKLDNRAPGWGHGHEEIIVALTANDPDAAAAVARRHLIESHTQLSRIISSMEPLHNLSVQEE